MIYKQCMALKVKKISFGSYKILSYLECSWENPWVFREHAPHAPHFSRLCLQVVVMVVVVDQVDLLWLLYNQALDQ